MREIKIISASVGIILAITLCIMVIGQTMQVVDFFAAINPLLGQFIFWLIIAIYMIFLTVPIIIYLKMPKEIRVPENRDSIKYDQAIKKLKSRFIKNKYLLDFTFTTNDEIDVYKAIAALDDEADKEIKSTARKVFLFTSVSQYGRLDGIVVLVLLSKLIYKVATIYNQRPSLKEILSIYINILGTMFLVSEMDNVEIIEVQFEPILEQTAGSMTTAFAAGSSNMTNIVTNSIIQGSANCFLTLRVGCIAKKYSQPLKKVDKKTILHSATMEAGKMFGKVLSESTKTLINTFIKSGSKVMVDKFKNGKNEVVDKFKGIFKSKS
ncbi:putative membrane protein [Desulfitispora alkaliphila]|uniref:DUF697 domain-containing protein n=1 Tax=Desulfitispora alkaliphila TaxID=622674 RepID=UPI003D1F95DE